LLARTHEARLGGMSATVERSILSDERLTELVALMQGADSAELKLMVPEASHRSAIAALGPIFVLKLKSTGERGRRLVTEMWLYPDGSRIFELSTKCATNEAFQVAAEGRALLVSRGVDLSGEDHTKTRKALEFFSAELQGATGAA
jgi:hypothetical protein